MALLKCPGIVKHNFYIVNTDNLVSIFWHFDKENKNMILSIKDVNNKDDTIAFKLPPDISGNYERDTFKYMDILMAYIADQKCVSLINAPTWEYLCNLKYRISKG